MGELLEVVFTVVGEGICNLLGGCFEWLITRPPKRPNPADKRPAER